MNLHSEKRLREIGKKKSNFKEGGGAGIVFEFDDRNCDFTEDYEFNKRGVIRFTVTNLPISSYMNRVIVEDAGYIDISFSPKVKNPDIQEMSGGYPNYVASPGFSRAGVHDFYDITDNFHISMNNTEATSVIFYTSDEFKDMYESIDDNMYDDEDEFSESIVKKPLIKKEKKLTLKSYLEKKLTVSPKEAQLIENTIKEYIQKKKKVNSK